MPVVVSVPDISVYAILTSSATNKPVSQPCRLPLCFFVLSPICQDQQDPETAKQAVAKRRRHTGVDEAAPRLSFFEALHPSYGDG